MHIVIIGNSIQSNMGLLYLNKRFGSQLKITRIGPRDRGNLPMVGESLIEISTYFFEKHLGLTNYFRDHHIPKYALTYYFKIDPDTPEDRRYSVHCNERSPVNLRKVEGWNSEMDHPPSWMLNREVFDRDLRKMADKIPEINQIFGMVLDVEINPNNKHILQVEQEDGTMASVEADWVIDGSGRTKLLGRKFNLIYKPEGQRDCFWFRIKDFDQNILKNIEAFGPEPPASTEDYHYDRYYSTHHFMGKGNWIWMIPMKSEDGSEMMSIGIAMRPDVFEGDIRSMEGFLNQTDKSHRVISDLVRSGTIMDTNKMKRFHHIAKQVYSIDRWAIVGDAAYSPDPLFSNGIAFGAIQWEQIGEMLSQDLQGVLTSKFVDALSKAILGPVVSTQSAITNWYPTMHDPFLSAIRLNWIEIAYFYNFLPLYINGCHYKPQHLELFRLLQGSADSQPYDIDESFLEARDTLGNITLGPEHFTYMGKDKVNSRAFDVLDNIRDIIAQGAEGGRVRNEYRRQVLQRVTDCLS